MQQRGSRRARTAGVLLAAVLATALLVGIGAAGAPVGSVAATSSGDVTSLETDATPSSATATKRLTVAGSATAVERPTTAERPSSAQAVDADRTRIRIDLQADGDATWTVELWTRLEDDADEAAFASLQEDVANDSDPYTADFRDQMNGSVTAVSDATGREMAIEDVTVSTRTEGVPSSYGVLAYEFEWAAFAAVDGDRLRAGDAIDGFLLEEGTRLTIGWPEGYRAESVQPSPDDRTDGAVVWRGGETDFFAGQPRVVVTTSSSSGDGSIAPIAAAIVVVAIALVLLAWLARTGRLSALWSPGDEEAGGGADSGDPSAESADTVAGQRSGSDGTGGPGGAGASDGRQPSGTGQPSGEEQSTDSDGADGEEPPPELLSNEEQVLRLLDEHGGRMKQQQVVAELEWTEAKTSQVVTSMREEELIEVFRIGRENVLALPGEADL